MKTEQLTANIKIEVTLRYRICNEILLFLMNCNIISGDKGIEIHKKLLNRSLRWKIDNGKWQAYKGKEVNREQSTTNNM